MKFLLELGYTRGQTRPELGLARPKLSLARPELGLNRPELGLAKPKLGLARPELGLARPELGLARPELGLTKPELGLARPELGLARPKLGLARPELGLTKPELGLNRVELRYFLQIWRFWYRNFVTVFFPFLSLLALNISIVRALTRDERLESYPTTAINHLSPGQTKRLRRKKIARSATRTTVLVVCTYLISNVINVVLTTWEHVDQVKAIRV